MEGKYRNKTIGEYREKLSVEGKHPSWVNSHIIPISSFTNDQLLSEVNNEDNVIPLCPNCHWEFDNLPRN